MCSFLRFIQKWEEIESLKNEKSPGIVLEKSWNSVFPFLYEPCNSKNIYNMMNLVCFVLFSGVPVIHRSTVQQGEKDHMYTVASYCERGSGSCSGRKINF